MFTKKIGIRSVFGGKESMVDVEEQCSGLVPSQLSSVTMYPNATDDELPWLLVCDCSYRPSQQ